jgi:hypothetical protein
MDWNIRELLSYYFFWRKREHDLVRTLIEQVEYLIYEISVEFNLNDRISQADRQTSFEINTMTVPF